MRVLSRECLVGSLLLLAVAVAGCQPVQPVAEADPAQAGDVAESGPITDTVTQVASEAVAANEAVTSSVGAPAEAVTATVAAGPEQSAGDVDPVLLADGLAVYRAQYCGVCHTLDAAETRGTFGPPHNGMGPIAVERLADAGYTGTATTPAEYVAESIVDPQAYIVPGYAATSHRMPVYAHLDQASVDAMVAFLLAQ